MSSTTSRASLYKPASGENVNVVTDVNNNWDTVDLNMNFRTCTSSTRPSTKWDGLCIHETDTRKSYVWNSTPAVSGWYQIYTAEAALDVVNVSGASTGAFTVTSKTTGNANPRFAVRSDGLLAWGDGTAAVDSYLYRSNTNALMTDGALTVAGAATVQSTTDSTAVNVSGGGTFAKSLTVGGTASLGGGQGVLGLRNATTAPTAVPSTGAILSAESGQLKVYNQFGAAPRVNGAYRLSATTTKTGTTTTETDICVLTIPANDAVVGATYRITAWGTTTHTAASPTLQWRSLLGANALASSGTLTCNASASSLRPWRIVTDLVCLATGGTGSWFATQQGFWTGNTTTALPVQSPQHFFDGSTPVTNATTSANDFKITFTWLAVTTSAQTMTCRGYHAERIA